MSPTLMDPDDEPLSPPSASSEQPDAAMARTSVRAGVSRVRMRFIAVSPFGIDGGNREEPRGRSQSPRRWGSLTSGADDERDDLLLGFRGGNLFTDLATPPHDGGPVGDLDHVVHGVGDDDDRAALVAK